ncbi:hypothetical protein SYN63AY4M2_08080 [Synechococcus sp. 63AY4M2]|nr:hypothetical protein CYA_2705 [Synechococcus sp. JA-3-3Ab]PIK84790.1 hypothetical protein SYN65AY6A5_11760 [Synechococcus sp. 65AY6A5]PIK87455.1 hypothetical protein SYN63AY4M2_08080 [Synechococcus sp. 63AY4M2]PIK93165.1 hypothetical protein SYN65AY6LI_05555 [Synechococcus sp. 65AY6Li]PIK96471.1 hypothetical protein SYN60AY4M2_08695 [Synechococcus sp. 60AY4M2]PIK99069.1 hypothetical protein SYN63AY4M1_06085 [Synechococcus sp. 63AY4M1]PIL02486.1 hypothetical protein SYN65AY640_07965 [Synech
MSQIVQSLPKKLAEKLEKSVRSEPFLAFFAYPIVLSAKSSLTWG